jgi:opacity protein-like surface antigen
MRKLLIVVALAWTLAPGTASAEWLLTPNVGGVFGGPADGGVTWGASLGWMGEGILGLEADLGFASNDLFTSEEADFFGIDRDLFDARVATVMGNAIVGVPVGGTTGKGVTPFFAAGLGLLRTNAEFNVQDEDLDVELFDSNQNAFALSLGTGVFGFVTDAIGLRGDIRWYYSITEPELETDLENVVGEPISLDNLDRDFWRATGGVTFRW